MLINFSFTTNTSPTIIRLSLTHHTVFLFFFLPRKFTSENRTLSLSHLTMSLIYLLLLFLCFSLHACNARRLSNLDHKKLEKKTDFSIKNDNNNGLELSPEQLRSTNGANKRKQTGLVAEGEKPIMDPRRTNQGVFKAKGKVASGSLQNHDQSLVSVSWHVPHKKNGDENPGFNLDYSPPKTHPPSHN